MTAPRSPPVDARTRLLHRSCAPHRWWRRCLARLAGAPMVASGQARGDPAHCRKGTARGKRAAPKRRCPKGAPLRGRAGPDEGGATEAHPPGWWPLPAEPPATKTHGAHGRTLETQAPATKRLTAKTHAAAGRTLKAQAPAAERAAAKAHPHRRSWRAHASAPKTQASAPEATTPEAAAAPAAGGGLAP